MCARATMSAGLFDVSGKTALVTGGSRGIGLMIARGLVQGGARVIVSSRKADDVAQTARELAKLGDCEAIPGDVSTPEGAERAGERRAGALPVARHPRQQRRRRMGRAARGVPGRTAGTRCCTPTSRASST